MRLLISSLLFVSSLAVSALVLPRPAFAQTSTLSVSEAIALASTEITKRKIDLSKFLPPEAEYDPKAKKWFVFYKGLAPKPGNHFTITVNDMNKVTRFWPGL
jgi:hypothetical protein